MPTIFGSGMVWTRESGKDILSDYDWAVAEVLRQNSKEGKDETLRLQGNGQSGAFLFQKRAFIRLCRRGGVS